MTNEKEREEFQKNYPMPHCIYWSADSAKYKAKYPDAVVSLIPYSARWEAWQACAAKKDAEIAELKKTVAAYEWISVADELPETKPFSYMCQMSDSVLVRGEGKNSYPWVAHLHADKNSPNYRDYAWGVDKNGARYTWLSPYRDISDSQKITHWRPLPSTIEHLDALLKAERERVACVAGEFLKAYNADAWLNNLLAAIRALD